MNSFKFSTPSSYRMGYLSSPLGRYSLFSSFQSQTLVYFQFLFVSVRPQSTFSSCSHFVTTDLSLLQQYNLERFQFTNVMQQVSKNTVEKCLFFTQSINKYRTNTTAINHSCSRFNRSLLFPLQPIDLVLFFSFNQSILFVFDLSQSLLSMFQSDQSTSIHK